MREEHQHHKPRSMQQEGQTEGEQEGSGGWEDWKRDHSHHGSNGPVEARAGGALSTVMGNWGHVPGEEKQEWGKKNGWASPYNNWGSEKQAVVGEKAPIPQPDSGAAAVAASQPYGAAAAVAMPRQPVAAQPVARQQPVAAEPVAAEPVARQQPVAVHRPTTAAQQAAAPGTSGSEPDTAAPAAEQPAASQDSSGSSGDPEETAPRAAEAAAEAPATDESSKSTGTSQQKDDTIINQSETPIVIR